MGDSGTDRGVVCDRFANGCVARRRQLAQPEQLELPLRNRPHFPVHGSLISSKVPRRARRGRRTPDADIPQ
jgi:hypothetical protein